MYIYIYIYMYIYMYVYTYKFFFYSLFQQMLAIGNFQKFLNFKPS